MPARSSCFHPLQIIFRRAFPTRVFHIYVNVYPFGPRVSRPRWGNSLYGFCMWIPCSTCEIYCWQNCCQKLLVFFLCHNSTISCCFLVLMDYEDRYQYKKDHTLLCRRFWHIHQGRRVWIKLWAAQDTLQHWRGGWRAGGWGLGVGKMAQ